MQHLTRCDGPRNEDRAEFARKALVTYVGETRFGSYQDASSMIREALGDLMVDLMHLADEWGRPVDLAMIEDHHDVEVAQCDYCGVIEGDPT